MKDQGENRHEFSRRNKKLRERALLTQTEFAELVGVAFSTVNRWETGKARPNIKAYCEKKGLPYEDVEKGMVGLQN